MKSLRFSAREIEWLAQTGRFRKNLLEYLSAFRFTGDVHAMPEGTVFFADEPILRVTAPLPEAQLVETRLINLLHFETLIASKAARHVLLAPGKELVDFGLRRAHGGEAGLLAARASAIAGFSGTATVLAGELFGIPLYGTMAHSFIEAFDSEAAAFEAFAHSRPQHLTILIDTYDTRAGARKVVALAKRLEPEGIKVGAVRLDSGDLIALSKAVRRILDEGGFPGIAIFASGGLDEDELSGVRAGRRAHRRLRHWHKPDNLLRPSGAGLRLQASGIRWFAAAKAFSGQGDLAGQKAGLAAIWAGGANGGRRAFIGMR